MTDNGQRVLEVMARQEWCTRKRSCGGISMVLSDERQTSIPDLIDRSDQIDVLMRGN